MAGKQVIYLVYDPSVEDVSTLSKFITVVLSKTTIPVDDVEMITQDAYIQYLDTIDSEAIPHSTICFNRTYRDVSLKYGNVLSLPTHEFFSRFFRSSKFNIQLLGLMFSINELFDDNAKKKTTWDKLQRFATDHKTYTSGIKATPTTPTVEKKPITPTPKKEVVEQQTNPVVDIQKPSYEELYSFYKSTQDLFKSLDVLKKGLL